MLQASWSNISSQHVAIAALNFVENWHQMILYDFYNIFSCFILTGFSFEVQTLVLRRIYPFLLACLIIVLFGIFQARQFRRLYEHIKNDK
jgi:hypothetical protein